MVTPSITRPKTGRKSPEAMPRDDARSQEKPKRPSLARRATSMLPSIRNPLDFDGDGVVSRRDFIPHFLDRDGDGHLAFADMSHDMNPT